MKNIGIIGIGVSSLHLGIKLVQSGCEVTIYSPKTADEIAASPMLNSVSHQFDTIIREREMGIEFWNESNCRVSQGHHHFINTHQDDPLFFWGKFDGYGRAIDYRLYLPRLMQVFEEIGGILQYSTLGVSDLNKTANDHDLIAIGVGKSSDGFADLFPRIDALSIHATPPRLICCGLYKGVNDSTFCGVTISISVGHGELIEIPMRSITGEVTVLLFENLPDGDMADLINLSYTDNPEKFNTLILEKLKTHHTSTYDRVDKEKFSLTRKLDLLQGSLLPITRRCYSEIGNGKYAIAIGDLRVTMDPVNGQGANLASYGACALANHIIDAGDNKLDGEFCEAYEKATEFRIEGTVKFNNAILNPQAHFLRLLHEMSINHKIADDFTSRFARPETIWWDILHSQEQTEKYIRSFS
jgi:hypothetical protein